MGLSFLNPVILQKSYLENLMHSEFDVRVSAASCISQIKRITAPDESYEEGHMKVVPVEENRGKTTVSEGLNEDIMKSSPQCRLLHSKDEAPSGRVSKHNPKESLSHLRKPTISNWGRGVVVIKLKTSWSSSIIHMIPPLEFTKRCASRVVGKEVVGRRIKIWWPLDKKFYGGKILFFDDNYKLHQIDNDDGEMEFLDLRGECWKLLKDGNSSAHMFLQPSKEALIADELVRYSEFDVRVSAASCISQIIRITAPDESYEEGHMKEFFLLANSAFEILSCMSGRAYSKAVPILHTMSNTQSCVLILDLELYATVGHIMVHLILDGIRTSYPSEVFSSMEKFMMVIICNTVYNDEFLLVLVKILLNSLRRENQKVSLVSFQLAENTFQNCSGDLKAYRSEALTCLDVPIEDYAEVVVSFFYDATQRENTVVPVEESRGKTTVSEGLNEDIMNSSPQCRLLHSKGEAPSGRVFKHNPKESLSHLRKPTISNWGRGAVGIILKTSWSSSIIHMIPPLEFTKRNMSNAGAPDSSIVEQLKKLLTKYGTELLKPCDSTEELLRKLDGLEHVLVHTLQEYKKLVEMLLQPSKEVLIANELIKHSELDVRVSVASCISQIIRITAPDEPYEEDQMKEFSLLGNSTFEILSCMSGRAYSNAFKSELFACIG